MPRHRINRAKSFLALSAILLVVAQAWAGGSFLTVQKTLAIARNEPSRVIVPIATHDFGTVPCGPELQTQFQLTNAGGRRLILHREDGGCPCLSTAPELSLPPGTSHPLAVRIQTNQLNGSVQSRICYRTNDPNCPLLELTVRANVVPVEPR